MDLYISHTSRLIPLSQTNIWMKPLIISLFPSTWMFEVDKIYRRCLRLCVFIRYLPLIRSNLKEKSNYRRLRTVLTVMLQGWGKLHDMPNVTELTSGRAGLKLYLSGISVCFPSTTPMASAIEFIYRFQSTD